MKILAFGIAKEIMGCGSIEIVLEKGTTVDVLKNKLAQQYPELGKLSSFMIAVNNEYATSSIIISEDDEVAIIPPVSGG